MNEPRFRYLDRAEICHLRSIGKTKQYEDEKSGKFPAGERHGMRTIRWRSDVVAQWLDQESRRVSEFSGEIEKRQSESAKKGVETKRQKRAGVAELAGQA